MKVILGGGGTGGHIFPALAIAGALRKKGVEILFAGAKGKMEMEKIPQAGYPIKGITISGLQRKITLNNLFVPFKILLSLYQSHAILNEFMPDVAVGVGGYASGPLLFMATLKGIPTLVQEQNSYPGITNRILGKRVNRICVAYNGMEKYFPAEKIVNAGNPYREGLLGISAKREDALKFWNFDKNKCTLLVLGGSLGARTINNSMKRHLSSFTSQPVQIIWQTGKLYYDEMKQYQPSLNDTEAAEKIRVCGFISRMDFAYAAADMVVSRAGAITLTELCITGKPAVLIPSPNVAEDHQTKNAMALVNQQAALILKDDEADEKFFNTVMDLLGNIEKRKTLSENINKLAKPDAVNVIADEIMKLGHRGIRISGKRI